MFYFIVDPGASNSLLAVTRATQDALKSEDVKDPFYLRKPGNVVFFNTDTKAKMGRMSTTAFNVLNKYVDYRGDAYKEELFKLYESIHQILDLYHQSGDHESDKYRQQFVIELNNLINKLDIDQVYKYTMEIEPIYIPPTLNATFDTQKETDGTGTRDQTYIIEDYKWLMCLVVIFKAIYGPLAHLMYNLDDNIRRYSELQMLDILKQLPLYKHHSFQKLKVYVAAVIDRAFEHDNLTNTKVLSNQLSRETIPEHWLAKGIFTKAVLIDQNDPGTTDLVRALYRDINNKTKTPGTAGDAIRDKNRPTESEGDGEDKESVIESYRLATEVPPGITMELNAAVATVDIILQQLPANIRSAINLEDVKLGMILAGRLSAADISNTHINIIAPLFKTIIDPRGIAYLETKNVLNMLAVSYAILKGYGVNPLAYLMMSKRSSAADDSEPIPVNMMLVHSKAKGYRTEELVKYYSTRKCISKFTATTAEDMPELAILDWVHTLYTEIKRYNWVVPTDLGVGIKDILVTDLRTMIIDMLIENERRIRG